MKKTLLIISILYFMVIVNCKIDFPPEPPEIIVEEVEQEEIEEEDPETVEVPDIIEEEEPAEVIMNDFTVKPISEFPAYYVQGNWISGIPVDAKSFNDLIPLPLTVECEEMENKDFPIKQFFTKDNKIYLIVAMMFPEQDEIVTKYCCQTAGKITYLTEAKFPAMPESERVEGETGIYRIEIGEYDGTVISIASRDYNEPMGKIDGFIELDGGLLIHAPDGRGTARPAGLLYWPEGKRNMDHWKEPGRFWK